MSAKLPVDAFAYYFALGPERSHAAIADKYGVSKRTVTRTAVQQDWAGQVVEMEAQARKKANAAMLETLEEMNLRHLKLLRVIQSKALEALKNLPLSKAMEAVRALELCIREERQARGEGDEGGKNIEQVIRGEYERWMVTDKEVPSDEPDEAE